MQRYVVPHFQKKNELRQISYDYSNANREVFVGSAQKAVETEIAKQQAREDAKKAGE